MVSHSLSISVVVLSYNRYPELARTLISCMQQDHQPSEIFVVDNGSEPSLLERLSSEFPGVSIYPINKNIGIAARNIGIEAATGDILVTIDDDISFDSSTAFRQIAAAFVRYPRAGCIAFRVYATDSRQLSSRDWCHP